MNYIPADYLLGLPDLVSAESFAFLGASAIHLDELDTKRKKRVDAKTYKKKLKEYFKNKCAYCDTHSERLTIDHVIPKSKSGLDDRSNWIPACRSCNLKKGDSVAYSWFQMQKFYDEKKWQRIVAILTGEIDVLDQISFDDLYNAYSSVEPGD